MSLRAALAAVLLVAGGAARADVVIDGNFHVGDEDSSSAFTPIDPVDCDKYRTYPTLFHLTESATITGFTLQAARGLDNGTLTLDVDNAQQSSLFCASCALCTGTASCGDITVDLTTGVALSAGYHTFAVVDPSGASGNCNTGNDFGWSALTLKSTATTTSIMLGQRRHAGDDDDADDEYDFTGNVSTSSSQFYPDADEATAVGISFTLGSNLRLTQIDLSRLRDVNTSSGNHGSVAVDGNTIGSLTGNGNPFTLTTALLLAAGSHTLTVTSGTLSGQRDDISWDGAVLRFSDVGSAGSVGFFNAVDTGENALTGKLRTKVAGGAISLKLYAMNGFGTGTNTSYAGSATVDVLDASNSSGSTDVYGCNSMWTVAQSLGSVTFSGGEAEITSGTFLDAGLKNARIRITDSTTQARGCSIDNFAIRPNSFSIAPSQGSETTAGTTTPLTNTGTSGLPRHKAGQPFTIVVTAMSANNTAATNYDGTPSVTGAVLAPATVPGNLTVGTWYSLGSGAQRTDTAKYSEVGGLTLTAEDTSWADVDSGDTASRKITGTASAGRFIPDHFNVTDGTLNPACIAGGFSYLGDALPWVSYAARLTAVSAGTPATPTLNYAGSFESLPATLASSPTYVDASGLAVSEVTPASPAISNAIAGVADITLPALKLARTRVSAFPAQLTALLPVFADDDGVAPVAQVTIGAASTGGVINFTGGASSQRFGRLYFQPTYGSEMLDMQIPLRAEYFDGPTFVTNTDDGPTCTYIGPTEVTTTPVSMGVDPDASVAFVGSGVWSVTVPAPGQPGQLKLSRAATLHPNLAADTDGDNAYDNDPEGIATFGLYTQDDRRIFQREMIGQ